MTTMTEASRSKQHVAPCQPEIHGTIIETFKNVVFLTKERSALHRRNVYVVRVIIGDLYRFRYAEDENAGYFLTEKKARAMYDKIVEAIHDEKLFNLFSCDLAYGWGSPDYG